MAMPITVVGNKPFVTGNLISRVTCPYILGSLFEKHSSWEWWNRIFINHLPWRLVYDHTWSSGEQYRPSWSPCIFFYYFPPFSKIEKKPPVDVTEHTLEFLSWMVLDIDLNVRLKRCEYCKTKCYKDQVYIITGFLIVRQNSD